VHIALLDARLVRPLVNLRSGSIMAKHHDFPDTVRSETGVLTLGFDPGLSLGSARPRSFAARLRVLEPRSRAGRSTSWGGRAGLQEGRDAHLVYSSFSHPNAEILEDRSCRSDRATSAACSTPGWPPS